MSSYHMPSDNLFIINNKILVSILWSLNILIHPTEELKLETRQTVMFGLNRFWGIWPSNFSPHLINPVRPHCQAFIRTISFSDEEEYLKNTLLMSSIKCVEVMAKVSVEASRRESKNTCMALVSRWDLVICVKWPFKANGCALCLLSGVNTGGVGSYIYDEPEAEAQPWASRQSSTSRTLDVSLICRTVTVTSDMYCAHRDGYLDVYVVFVYGL